MGRVVYRSDNPNGFRTGRDFSVDEPCLSVMAAGLGGDSLGHWHFADAGGADVRPKQTSKPPYRVPSMDEVRAAGWCGLTVASTFAGCGGSSLGYRMAGYRVLWASEFVPIAQESYRANMEPRTVLDGRDVREVKSEEILAAAGLEQGELDVLDGSPPCQAFSTAGKRAKGWGTEKRYEHGATQRNEDLFFEYVRLLEGLRPRAFVAENVTGLVKGVAKGYFLDILAALKGCGYRVRARVLDAQWLGVPQARQRVIFVGVREDLMLDPVFPAPLPHRYSVRDALPWIGGGRVVHDTSGTHSVGDCTDVPAPAVVAQRPSFTVRQGTGNGHSSQRGQSVSLEAPAPTIITKAHQFEVEDEAAIAGAIAGGYDELNPGQYHPKYKQLVRADANGPSPTISAAHGMNRGVAGTVHPTEKRRFSIAELKRICAFPDDFELRGSYAQQWERLGNSVPPLMMRAVAEALRDRVLLPSRARSAAPAAGSAARSTSGSRRRGGARPPPAAR